MAVNAALDLDLLRTLAIIAEEQSFTRAGERVGRTQSTVSLQVQRLEAMVGKPLVVRGRGNSVELTHEGHLLVERSKALLRINDEILSDLRTVRTHATVRLGAPDTYAQLFLSPVLQRFGTEHPSTSVQLSHGWSCQLSSMIKAGELDLMLCNEGHEPRQWPTVELMRFPLRWMTSEKHDAHRVDPLPLAVSPDECPWRAAWMDECIWRGAARRALERAGRSYRIVSTSSAVEGQQALAVSGLAVTVLIEHMLIPGLRVITPDEGLPELPDTSLLLLKSPEARQPETDTLASIIVDTFRLLRQEAAPFPSLS